MIPGKLPIVKENITKVGQHLMGVFGGPEGDFVYTIGNCDRGLPELLLLGQFDPEVVGYLLNALGDKMRKQERAFDEGFVDLGSQFPVKIRRATDVVKERFTIQVGQYLGHEDYTVLQVVLCDKTGKYPGDEGVHKAFDVELV